MLQFLDDFLIKFVNFMWGTPLLALMLGGGLFFTLNSSFIPFKYIRHSINNLFGK